MWYLLTLKHLEVLKVTTFCSQSFETEVSKCVYIINQRTYTEVYCDSQNSYSPPEILTEPLKFSAFNL